jgi:hypothetical protein
MAESLGELDRSEALQAESLAIGRELGDGAIIGRALNNLGIVARIRGEALPAVALHEEALALARAAGDPVQIDSSLCGLATALVLPATSTAPPNAWPRVWRFAAIWGILPVPP